MRSKNNILKELKNKTIAIIAGGISNEREISFRSAENVLKSMIGMGLDARVLDASDSRFSSQVYDVAFNCMHGAWGEDGCIQGYLEIRGIPYTGSRCLTASISNNKPMFNAMLRTLGIDVPDSVSPESMDVYPFIAKPRSGGSSIGVHLVHSKEAWRALVKSDPSVTTNDYFFEAYIPGVEVTCGILQDGDTLHSLPVLEIETRREFYDYEGKYTQGESQLIVPARIDAEITDHIQSIGKKIFSFFECRGCVRIDMIVNNGMPIVLEMNTVPGLTNLSDIPAQAAAYNISFDDLVLTYLNSAIY